MRTIVILFFLCLSFDPLHAQVYKPKAARYNDSFSLSLEKLLISAINGFKSAKGKFFQVSFLSEPEYLSSIILPGSVAGIIRERMPTYTEAHFEFRGYKNREQALTAMDAISLRIKRSLKNKITINKYNMDSYPAISINLETKDGFFATNIELMLSSGSDPVYLYKTTEKYLAEKNQAISENGVGYFILLKVSPGVPVYHYKILRKRVKDSSRFSIKLSELIHQAGEDFKASGLINRQSLIDTLSLPGYRISINAGGQQRTAILTKRIRPDSAAIMMEILHQRLETILGDGYNYLKSATDNLAISNFHYYPKLSTEHKGRIYLEATELRKDEYQLRIIITCPHSHPVKRSAGFIDDLD